MEVQRCYADPLQRGRVDMEPDEEEDHADRVNVDIRGAAPNATYAVQFCSSARGFSACQMVGSVSTDEEGRAEDHLPFPQHGTFSGVFVLARNGNQFITGFTVPQDDSSGDDVFRVGLQPIAAINDHLGLGSIASGDSAREARTEVHRDGGASAKLEGAPANVSYSVNFCPFGMSLSSCSQVATLSTNEEGEGHVDFIFPSGTHEGIFLLQRGGTDEFASGFLVR
jgi:hypothetical protein